MKTTFRALSVLLVAISVAVLATGCGSSHPTSAKITGDPTDRAFVQEMIPHHRSAIAMATLARSEARSAFVKTLATNIIRSQSSEIVLMERVDHELASAGISVGSLGMNAQMMGMAMSPAQLKGARPFDRRFMQMMVPHHEGAIAMAKVELAHGANAQLRALAGRIIAAQQREVNEMNAHLKTA